MYNRLSKESVSKKIAEKEEEYKLKKTKKNGS